VVPVGCLAEPQTRRQPFECPDPRPGIRPPLGTGAREGLFELLGDVPTHRLERDRPGGPLHAVRAPVGAVGEPVLLDGPFDRHLVRAVVPPRKGVPAHVEEMEEQYGEPEAVVVLGPL